MKRVLAIIALLLGGCSSQSPSEGAHAHGVVRLNIAIDGPQGGTVELITPSETLFGFEHVPSTAEDQAAQASALAILEDRFETVLAMDAALSCRYEPIDVSVVYEDDEADDDDHADEDAEDDGYEDDDDRDGESGVHSEVRAMWTLSCTGDPNGSTARAAFSDAFPGVDELLVTVLSDSGQSSVTLPSGDGQVDL